MLSLNIAKQFIYSFIEYLLSACFMPGIVLVAEDIAVNKNETYILMEEVNKQGKLHIRWH